MLRTSVFSLALLSLALAGPVDDFESRVTEFKLANGLPVLVYTDSSAPMVTVAVAYKVGSNYEPAGKTGLSHMLEHMTFQHSDMYKPGEFFRFEPRAATGATVTLVFEPTERFLQDLAAVRAGKLQRH